MEIITLTKDNLEKEHICCAISNNNDPQVSSKKQWLLKEFDNGLVFKKGNIRGKCFIEYIPCENAWAPIKADGYMYIDCFWVSGQFKGQGNSNILLEECIMDSKEKGKKGLVVLSSKKKLPFLSDPGYLKHKGFLLADTKEPYFELYYLPFSENTEKPQFISTVSMQSEGFTLYYTHQCPFNIKYVALIESIAKDRNVPFKSIKFENKEQAQNAPSPFTIYSLFHNGKFITHEILSEKKFGKILTDFGF